MQINILFYLLKGNIIQKVVNLIYQIDKVLKVFWIYDDSWYVFAKRYANVNHGAESFWCLKYCNNFVLSALH